jgi:transcriptional regulator with XRE-family HTH domain
MHHNLTIGTMPRVSGLHDKDQSLVKIGDAIRSRRKRLEMSQEALAASAGIDRAHMGKIERGERNVTLLNLVRISQALRCNLSEVLIEAGM